MKTYRLIAILTLVLGGHSFAVAAHAADAESVEAILEQAQAVHGQALALEHGWSVTQPFIDDARAALAAGDEDSARALAERALLTAEKSLEQAKTESTAWKERVLGR